jgi:hypothetical protein
MPKAAIHEDRKPSAGESKVGFAGKVCGLQSPSTNAGGHECSTKLPFSRTGVLAAHRSHDARALAFTDCVHRRGRDDGLMQLDLERCIGFDFFKPAIVSLNNVPEFCRELLLFAGAHLDDVRSHKILDSQNRNAADDALVFGEVIRLRNLVTGHEQVRMQSRRKIFCGFPE